MRRSAVVSLVSALALTAGLAGCGSGDSADSDGKTRVSVNCMPPKSAKVDRANYQADLKEFERANPDIDLVPSDAFPCQDPKTFDAKLSGGQMEDVFYTYFTDIGHVVDIDQAADITSYVEELDSWKTLDPALKELYTVDGKVYGVPRTNYSLGLLYNRKLFTAAGLDPDKPPTTWPEVRAAAKKIAALGEGHVGFAEFSSQNQGGWHFTASVYSQGGSVVDAAGKRATVDSPAGRAVLETLRDMRWTDDSMGSKQLLVINDVQQMMGSGKLGMYVAAPDNVPLIVNQFGGRYQDLALAPMPGGKGTLTGGDGYLFNRKATPEQIRAGLKWLDFHTLTPGSGLNDWARGAKQDTPVGLPEPRLWTGDTADEAEKLKAEHANVPVENYRSFTEGSAALEGKLEPPKAQQIYSVLDGAVSAVLTKKDADIPRLLKDAQGKIDGILARG